jgi:RNA-binding protein
MIELTPAQRRALRASAHALHPVVSVSQKGLTDTVLKEIDRCLKSHELIKIRIYDTERDQREALMSEIASALHCAPVQHIGNILVVWREKPETDDEAASTRKRAGVRLTKRQAAEPPRRRRAVR